MHENLKPIFREHCLDYFTPGLLVLEIGPAYPTPSWYEQELIERDREKHFKWSTIDVNPKRTDVTYIAKPHNYAGLAKDLYDVVFASMVIEHTPRPWDWIKELARVCRPGGHVIVLAPFIGPKHGKDYWRVLPEGLMVLANVAKLGIVKAELYEIAPGDWRGPDTVHADSLLIARKP